jgi:hypothetical protein
VKKSLLIVGDAHARPGVSNERFKWLADYAFDKKADIIVDMGDWADMPSLSSYDLGKRSYEGRRYIKDIEAALDARKVFNSQLENRNKSTKRGRDVWYSPQKVSLGGNHCEGRISRVIEDDPKLDGLIGIEDLGYKEFGWEYVPFRTPITIQGFAFCHYFTSGVMGRPISGEVPALSLLRKQFSSCITGHSHLWDVAHRTRPDGKRVWGIVAGCYLAEDQWESYASEANKMWWKGLTLLKGAEDGDFDSMETISIKELKDLYGARKRG